MNKMKFNNEPECFRKYTIKDATSDTNKHCSFLLNLSDQFSFRGFIFYGIVYRFSLLKFKVINNPMLF